MYAPNVQKLNPQLPSQAWLGLTKTEAQKYPLGQIQPYMAFIAIYLLPLYNGGGVEQW